MQIVDKGFKIIESTDLIDFKVLNDNVTTLIGELKATDESIKNNKKDIDDAVSDIGDVGKDIENLQKQIDDIDAYIGGILDKEF